MNSQTSLLRSAAALVCLAMLPSVQAATVTYDFAVFGMTGPGDIATYGHFSYDSASVRAGGTNSGTGLLTDLEFQLDGDWYDEATANTGSLTFNSLGGLSSFLIGNFCAPGNCLVMPGFYDWSIGSSGLRYSRTGWNQIFTSDAPDFFLRNSVVPGSVPVPEPASWALVLAGGLAAWATRRRVTRR